MTTLMMILMTTLASANVNLPDASHLMGVNRNLKAYINSIYNCNKNDDSVTYTLYNNDRDEGYVGHHCAASYYYKRCTQKSSEFYERCSQREDWKVVTQEKLLVDSTLNEKVCVNKINQKKKYLESLGFKCTFSGVN
ncbi:MAG: hypothetical protein CME63_03265 [Halobacteriovoraceae bacterium]|nr:hypothetical protein [Halobacteriovoraceae bacterium]MBC96740.1 hypothetical protein [Halobacteriovoraceae bacterium]